MGLDIIAYKELKAVENVETDEYGYPLSNKHFKPMSMKFSEKYFPGRGEGIEQDKIYEWNDALAFRAGSYSGYNVWRAHLENFSNGTNDFEELINFPDNEGVIGPVVSKKLLNDFIKNHEKAIEYSNEIENGDLWLMRYKQWENAFRYASQNGAVAFC